LCACRDVAGVIYTVLEDHSTMTAADCAAIKSASGVSLVFDVALNACVAPDSTTGECYSVLSAPPSAPYKFVRGEVAAVQRGELCAFGPTGRASHDINGERIVALGVMWRYVCRGGGVAAVWRRCYGGDRGVCNMMRGVSSMLRRRDPCAVRLTTNSRMT
jgi:hypothetical protein